MRLREIGEFGFIDRIKGGCLVRDRDVIRGIGDDCAVVRASGGGVSLLTTDMLVEDVHFRRDRIPPFKLGRKALAVNVSDIAAMGGLPREAMVSLAIPETVPLEYLEGLYAGMKALAAEFEVNLVGGDTTRAPERLVINVALTGEAAEDEIRYRSGAGPGEVVFLTGPVGSSAAGLHLLLSDRPGEDFQGKDVLLEAHLDPRPHVEAGRIIAASKAAGALIDVSDGLAGDLGHICADSGIGAVIEEERIPTTAPFREYCARCGLDPLPLILSGGEDYVLLGTVPEPSAQSLAEALAAGGCAFHPIGRTRPEPGIELIGRDGSRREIEPAGWNHFAGS